MSSNLEKETENVSNNEKVEDKSTDQPKDTQSNASSETSKPVLFESNEKESIKSEIPTHSVKDVSRKVQNVNNKLNNYLVWAVYLSVVFVIGYNLSQTTDPIKIGILLTGGLITIFFAKRLLTTRRYKVEDDDDGSNLIEGY